MVEKIMVSPRKVRAYGNVVDVKELEDYDSFRCDTSVGSEVINGVEERVFEMSSFGHVTSLSLSGSNVVYGRHVPLNAYLSHEENDYETGIPGKEIVLMEGDTVLRRKDTITAVWINGECSFDDVFLPVGDHVLHAEFEGDDEYTPSRSGDVTINVRKASYNIQWETDKLVYDIGDTIVITGTVGTLMDQVVDGEVVEVRQLATNTLIKLSPYGVNLSCTTDENGAFRFETVATAPNSSGRLNLLLYLQGTDTHFSIGQNIYIPICPQEDLQSYLLDTSGYGFASGSASKLSVESSSELKGSATVLCMNGDEFTDSRHYTLTFDWKLSRGYDGGFVMGDENDYWAFSQQYVIAPVQHGSGSNDSGGGAAYQDKSSSSRFTSYVPVVITRDGDDWTIDVNSGELQYSFTASHSNRFGIRVWGSGYCYVKNLKLTLHHILYDKADYDNSETLFGGQYSLRYIGTNTVEWVDDGHYLLTNVGSQRESMRVLNPLTGMTGDFVLEYDSYIEGTNGSSGLVIYNGNSSWEKLTDDGDSTKRTWYGYNNGSFHETGYYASIVTNRKWIHYRYAVKGNVFSIEITYEGSVVWSHSETMHLARNSSTLYGLDCEWQNNTKTRYRNLRAYVL